MADEQLEWVFDSLVEFLRGPIWNIPVLTFIEQKSVVFEPGAENEEEMKKIHEAYKNLVDFMLGSYMEDLRITPEEFEKSCSVATKKALNQFHQSLFQQVWAADDFEIFRRMMTQKNLELQLQALEFLTQKRGSIPNCMESNDVMKDDEKSMEEIIKKAIEDVRAETAESESNEITPADTALQEKMKLEAQKEKELLEQAMKQSVKEKDTEENCPEKSEPNPPEEPLEADLVPNGIQQEEEIQSETEPGSDEERQPECGAEDEPQSEPAISEVEDPKEGEAEPTKPAHSLPQLPKVSLHSSLPPIQHERASMAPPMTPPMTPPEDRPWSEGDGKVYEEKSQVEVTPMDMERRQNYLRQQRDRILAMKKQERSRRLSNTDEMITQSRPKSARAARKALREESTDDVDPQTLVFRKTLAAKLRSEVIDRID